MISDILDLNQEICFYKAIGKVKNTLLPIKMKILKEFYTLSNKLSDNKVINYHKLIESTTSISLHIRRGDYVTNPTTNSFTWYMQYRIL